MLYTQLEHSLKFYYIYFFKFIQVFSVNKGKITKLVRNLKTQVMHLNTRVQILMNYYKLSVMALINYFKIVLVFLKDKLRRYYSFCQIDVFSGKNTKIMFSASKTKFHSI